LNLLADEPQRFGDALGATLWGGTLYELAPGEETRYHWQFGEEEFLIVVGGQLTLRTPEGERALEPWDVAWFVRGEPGAHQVRNDADVPARVVFFSTCSDPEVVVYPDEGVVGFVADWSHSDRARVSAKAAFEGRAEPRPPPQREAASFNLLAGELDAVEERPGYRFRAARPGGKLGAELLGATLYETPPGEKLWPYHWEAGCEEFLVVVTGRPTLRTPVGGRELARGDVVHFPEGEPGTHQLWNDAAEPFRVLIASTKAPLTVCGYPDSSKILIDLPGRRRMLRDGPDLDYWDGET
jgi:uncharacterized cupin superfamily protein